MFSFKKKRAFRTNQRKRKKRFNLDFFKKKQLSKQLFYSKKSKNPKKLLFFGEIKSNFLRRFLIRLSYILLFALFLGLVFVFFFTSLFVVQNINLGRENVRVDSGQIIDSLNKYLYQNMFLISTGKIKKEIEKQFPEYKEISVKRVFPNSLVIQVTNFEIVAQVKVYIKPQTKYSGTGGNLLETIELKAYEQDIVINSEGIAEQKSDIHKSLPLIEIIGIHDFPFVQGDILIEKDYLALIFEARQKLFDEIKLTSNSIKFFSDAREAHLLTEKGYEIWIDFLTPIGEQIDKLKKISNYVDWNENPPEDHIDLRVKNRIIYR